MRDLEAMAARANDRFVVLVAERIRNQPEAATASLRWLMAG
jgi:hypothetical protein